MKRLTAIALLAATAVGCGPTTRNYSVLVKNDGVEPMTVVLTKDGPPMEMNWLPPEDFAAMRKAPPEAKVNSVVIQPGESADQARTGKFDDTTQAMLRIYRGPQTLESMLGVGPFSPNRTDLALQPGHNTIVIDKTGKATLK